MSQKTKKTFHKRPQHEEETETTLYEGRNEVMELLRAGRTVDKLFVAPDQNGRHGGYCRYGEGCRCCCDAGRPPQAGRHE